MILETRRMKRKPPKQARTFGRLNLDDLGTQVRQILGCERSSPDPSEVADPNTLEWTARLTCCARAPLFAIHPGTRQVRSRLPCFAVVFAESWGGAPQCPPRLVEFVAGAELAGAVGGGGEEAACVQVVIGIELCHRRNWCNAHPCVLRLHRELVDRLCRQPLPQIDTD